MQTSALSADKFAVAAFQALHREQALAVDRSPLYQADLLTTLLTSCAAAQQIYHASVCSAVDAAGAVIQQLGDAAAQGGDRQRQFQYLSGYLERAVAPRDDAASR